MEKEDIEIWCADNNFVLIDMNIKGKDSILFKDAMNIVASVCEINSGDMRIKTRDQYVVFARALMYSFLRKTTKLSFRTIGLIFSGLDHSSVVCGLKAINTERLTGWRKYYKHEFEKEINETHLKLGFKEVY